MTSVLVAELLDACEGVGIPIWIAGGWGVDALVGRQTREHRDLDVLYPIERDADLRRILADGGYVPETDWWPIRVEFAGRSYVDIHPLRFAPDGSAVQAGPDGTEFDYPARAFRTGSIGDRMVGCLSVEQQRTFHSGYALRDVDRHDLAQLAGLDPPAAPPAFG
jgi:lincosamide nucleotidyltransferase A/C/D/E